MKQGNIYIISAPSGAGKTSLVRRLLQDEPNILKSISYTTRAPRAVEQHARDYFFISPKEFQQKITTNDFLEYALVFENFYGTSKSWVAEKLAAGLDIIFEIDWQGATAIKSLYPNNSVSIFILPPNKQVLLQRLKGRGTESDAVIATRFKIASYEISKSKEYDFLLLNDDFERTFMELKLIINASKLKLNKQIFKYQDLIAEWNND